MLRVRSDVRREERGKDDKNQNYKAQQGEQVTRELVPPFGEASAFLLERGQEIRFQLFTHG